MKVVVPILLLAALPVPQVQLRHAGGEARPHFAEKAQATPQKKGGKWYLARTGHAVYCYGPVMTLINNEGEVERVATFCRGEELLVPLKD
jgi:hypothetical protein